MLGTLMLAPLAQAQAKILRCRCSSTKSNALEHYLGAFVLFAIKYSASALLCAPFLRKTLPAN